MDRQTIREMKLDNLSKEEMEELIFTLPLSEISKILKEYDDNTKNPLIKNLWKDNYIKVKCKIMK